ncbi:hypothetical protein MMC30_005300 [Trapelia coarctata]|nr:hypothetical protein [Trapelia coarctata]
MTLDVHFDSIENFIRLLHSISSLTTSAPQVSHPSTYELEAELRQQNHKIITQKKRLNMLLKSSASTSKLVRSPPLSIFNHPAIIIPAHNPSINESDHPPFSPIVQLFKILSHRHGSLVHSNIFSLANFASAAADESKAMFCVTQSARKDSRVMRTVSWIALAYLPATLIAVSSSSLLPPFVERRTA